MSDPAQDAQPSLQELQRFYADNHALMVAMADFRRMFHIYRNRVERYFAARGLTHLQYAILLELCARGPDDEAYTVGELAAHFDLINSSCVQLLDRMEARGLLQRIQEGNSARVVLTELGMRTTYTFLEVSGPPEYPPNNLRSMLIEAIVEASRMEHDFYAARNIPYPKVPFYRQDGPDDEPSI